MKITGTAGAVVCKGQHSLKSEETALTDCVFTRTHVDTEAHSGLLGRNRVVHRGVALSNGTVVSEDVGKSTLTVSRPGAADVVVSGSICHLPTTSERYLTLQAGDVSQRVDADGSIQADTVERHAYTSSTTHWNIHNGQAIGQELGSAGCGPDQLSWQIEHQGALDSGGQIVEGNNAIPLPLFPIR